MSVNLSRQLDSMVTEGPPVGSYAGNPAARCPRSYFQCRPDICHLGSFRFQYPATCHGRLDSPAPLILVYQRPILTALARMVATHCQLTIRRVDNWSAPQVPAPMR